MMETELIEILIAINTMLLDINLPGSEASKLCCDAGGWERGPGVPGDLTSSLTGPPQDNDDDGGLCNQKQYFGINDDILSTEQQEQMVFIYIR